MTLCDLMDCSPPDSSVHGDSPGKNTEVGCHALLQGIFPTQGSNPGLPHCRWILYCLSHQGSPPGKLIPWPPSITHLPLALATAEGWSCFCVYLSPPGPPRPHSLTHCRPGGSQWWQISCTFFTWSIHPTRAVSQKVNLIRRAVKKEVLRHQGCNLKLIFQSWVSDGQARSSRKSQFEIFTGNSWHKDLDPFQSSQAFASVLSYESKKSWLLPKVWSFQLISKTVKKILIAA